MLDQLFKGVFDNTTQPVIALSEFSICVLGALALGLMLALVYRLHSRASQGFIVTLALLPAVVCMVILLVNGNVGAGVAVAGAFSLVRFRSVPGTAQEIGALFIAMATGLCAGIGYLAFAALFAAILSAAQLLLCTTGFGTGREREKTLRVTIPEELDYTGVFGEIFDQYTGSCQLYEVKTTNMGSLFRLTYQLTLKNPALEKQLLDALRCRNGNLEVSLSRQGVGQYEL